MLKKVFFAVFILIGLSSCLKDTSSSFCEYDECAFKAPSSEIQQVQQYLSAQNITNATQHCSGLFYTISNPGSGVTPTVCSYITATYKGYLTDGTVFEQGSLPQPYQLNRLIRGWVNGLLNIKQGGSMILYIPPSLGYGSQGSSSIPPNSVLIFEITLDTVQ